MKLRAAIHLKAEGSTAFDCLRDPMPSTSASSVGVPGPTMSRQQLIQTLAMWTPPMMTTTVFLQVSNVTFIANLASINLLNGL